jgi:hypothetical protein
MSYGIFPSGETEGGQSGLTVIETYTSPAIRQDDERIRRVREFIVYGELGTLDQALAAVNIQYGDPHPDDPAAVAVDVDASILPETGRFAARVAYTYSAERELLAEFSIDADLEFVDTWRVPVVNDDGSGFPLLFPADGIPPLERTDIGGCPVDIGGQPISRPLRIGRYQTAQNYTREDFNFATLFDAVGCRNDAEFLGFPRGSLLYGRPRSTNLAFNTIRVTHEFVVDPLQLHMRQQARANEEGIELTNDHPCTGVGFGTYASFVYWVQPYPRLIDFEVLGITP